MIWIVDYFHDLDGSKFLSLYDHNNITNTVSLTVQKVVTDITVQM